MMHWKQDIKSKIQDGLVTALILFLLLVMSVILVRPIENVAGRPGLLVYILSLMALSVYCLEHSLQTGSPDTSHAWFGMAGGLLGWISISLSNDIDVPSITSVTGILVLILFGLAVTRLWKRHLPVGGRFYSLSLLLGWIGQLIIESRALLIACYPPLKLVYGLLIYVCAVAIFVTLWLLFNVTEKRVQRSAAAPWLVFFLAILTFSLR